MRSRIVGKSRPDHSKAWMRILTSVVALFVVVQVLMLKLVFLPAEVVPEHVDAVLVLGPADSERLALAEFLMNEGYSDSLVISAPDDESRFGKGQISACNESRDYFVFCGRSVPYTTQGEMALIQKLSDREGWDSVLVVTSKTHASRVSLYAERCFDGESAVVWVDPTLSPDRALQQFFYQSAAFVKAFTFTTGCVDDWVLW